MALPIIPDPPATRIQGEDVSEIDEGTGQEKAITQMDKRNRHSGPSQLAHLRIN